ncbi:MULTISPECIES: phage antirepressor KilAC domain-containing protein [Allobacillus]|uniref:Antirepressor protein C-terminal domain-containing protein n=1 Tax=Allobacillus salarius TaxID=1955272 RepID=A0A556PDP5_9BACI|nr:phage antirepressor KilAC domain-containing protein [Allobacillus salarius]TSJ62493.1 hypothetical protein FPQ13_09875 [Allobacillus salarius]
MGQQRLMKMEPMERVVYVNTLLQKETSNHLKNVAKNLGMSPSTFSKIMREGNFQYHQVDKMYYKLVPLQEYKKMKPNSSSHTDDLMDFLTENIDELKRIIEFSSKQPIIEPEVYDPKAKSVIKSVQVNSDIYSRFQNLATRFPHLRLNTLISQCFLDFIRKYEE